MKPTADLKSRWMRVLPICMVMLVCLGLVAGCPAAYPAPQTVGQATGCDWKVWRYDGSSSNKAWASLSSLLTLDRLSSAKVSLWCNGYVATDATGQGCLSRASNCNQVWFWQKSGWSFGTDALSACAKGSTSVACSASSTTTVKNCAVKIVTKPASISVRGTIVTAADDQDLQLTLVIVHEGAVDVEPAALPGTSVPLETGQAAYYVSPEMTQDQLDQITNVLGFAPNQPVSLDLIVPLVEWMQLVPQIQRANAVVLGEGEIVPLPVPFAWSLRSLEEQLPQDLANELAESWRTAVRWEDLPYAFAYAAWLEQDIPFIRQFTGPDLSVPDEADYADLRGIPSTSDIGLLQEAMTKAGYDTSKEVVLLVAEEAMEELMPIADWIAQQLNDLGLPTITQAVNSDAMEGVLAEWQAAGNPVFLLTWY